MSRKTFVIDTNVLLHDPDALKQFGQNDVVIPLAVLEELDAMKRFRDEIAKNARQVLRFLGGLKKRGIGDLHEGVTLKEGPKIRIQLEINTERSLKFAFSATSTHYRILMGAYYLFEKGEPVIFVSKDLTMRVKAEAMGLKAEDYENQKFAYDTLYKGIRKIELTKPQIDLFYKDGRVEVGEQNFIANEYCVMSAPQESSAIGRYDSKTKSVVSLVRFPQHIWGINPINVEQKGALDLLLRDDVKLVTLVGPAGTGKTLLALAAGLRKVFDEGVYNRILVSRPIMPLGKDIGYLPGLKEEKLIHWMQPIYDNLEFLCDSSGSGEGSDTFRWVTESKKIEMEAVTYIRGRSLPKMYMIIDEAQNLTPHEVKTVISRAGKGAKVVLTGDPTQIDNPYLDKNSNGLTYVVGKFQNHSLYGHMFMERTERSELAALAAEIM